MWDRAEVPGQFCKKFTRGGVACFGESVYHLNSSLISRPILSPFSKPVFLDHSIDQSIFNISDGRS